MRSGVLGMMLAWSVGATMAWGQVAPDQRYPAGPPIIPPRLPNYANYGPGPDAQGNPMYPPPGNWDANDLANPAGGVEGSTPRWWLNAEFLMWFPKSATFPAPILTGSSPNNAGIVGNSSTIIIDGNGSVNFDMVTGFRVGGGTWFDADGRYGWDASGFGLESRSRNFLLQTTPDVAPVIARPFVNDQNMGTGSYVVAAPGFGIGYAADTVKTQSWGIDSHLLMNLYRSAADSGIGYSLTALGGIRFFQLTEQVTLLSSTSLFPGNSVYFNNALISAVPSNPANAFLARNFIFATQTTTTSTTVNLAVLDQFKTRNDFYGGDLGLYQQFNMGRWSLGLATKVALGGMRQTTQVIGFSNLRYNATSTVVTNVTRLGANVFNQTTTTNSTDNNIVPGGVYAQAGNIGTYDRTMFAVLPEVNFRVGYTFTPAITGYVSYNAIYLDRVVRAPELITGYVNPTQQPTNAQFGNPSLPRQFNPFPTSDFWLQGVTFGLNVRF